MSSLDEIVSALEHDAADHITAGPDRPDELNRTEQRLGVPLPEEFRRFLERVGGGLYYQCHEIFGSHRVMIHDIELLPDLTTFRRLEQQVHGVPETLLPFLRSGGTVYAFDLSHAKGSAAPVRSLDGTRSYPGFLQFLEELVLSHGRPRDS